MHTQEVEVLVLQENASCEKKLRRIPPKVRAISAKINYLKSTHRKATFGIPPKTTHFSSFL